MQAAGHGLAPRALGNRLGGEGRGREKKQERQARDGRINLAGEHLPKRPSIHVLDTKFMDIYN